MSCSSSFTCKIYLFWLFSFTLMYFLWLKRRIFLVLVFHFEFAAYNAFFSFERADHNYIAWGILCSLCFSLTVYVTVLMVVEAASSERTPPLSRCAMILYDSVSWPWVLLTNHFWSCHAIWEIKWDKVWKSKISWKVKTKHLNKKNNR